MHEWLVYPHAYIHIHECTTYTQTNTYIKGIKLYLGETQSLRNTGYQLASSVILIQYPYYITSLPVPYLYMTII